ncbi:unnamed protein product [Euphydryas editha]|uniref:Uncharacterized protein n=1 Tax=Euphydryas editha TaxID=104508 RepID=A0AAU9U7A3_EUPED|nr:unnamed protein product [Euphydryas editha]
MHVLFTFILFTIAEGRKSSHKLPISPNKETNNKRLEASQQGIDFGHVYRNGFRGSIGQFDHEHDMVQVDIENAKELKQKPHKNMDSEIIKKPVFLSPRDEILYHKKINKSFIQTQLDEAKEKNDSDSDARARSMTRPPWFDFSRLLERNIAYPIANRRRKIFDTKNDRKFEQVKSKVQIVNLSSYFEKNTFLKRSNVKLNWTTCSEFAKRAVFHPDDVVNTIWLPFYIWSKRDFTSSIIHTFSYPTKKTVQFFKNTYGPYMQKLNWNEPKLLLKERREILLIAGDRRGLFYGVPKLELPSYIEDKNITFPIITLRMKIHDPYLAMMYCDENYAVIMAESGTEPHSDEDKILEAGTLKFKGTGKPASRDLASEAMLAELEKEKKKEAESRKIIPIEISSFDLKIRH